MTGRVQSEQLLRERVRARGHSDCLLASGVGGSGGCIGVEAIGCVCLYQPILHVLSVAGHPLDILIDKFKSTAIPTRQTVIRIVVNESLELQGK